MTLSENVKEISAGVDIENIDRFTKLSFKKNRYFFDLIYTPKEMEYCFSKPNPYPHFAARFAGKEAVIKAVSGFGNLINPKEVEILINSQGVPVAYINNKNAGHIKVILSLSHSKDRAIAFALGVKNGNHK
ncbi:MAG: holo-ACP synthase [Candidatus Gorgyraea atricola]|nr:holo-ACP synthase [Candidatus Gorgyraea atricola]